MNKIFAVYEYNHGYVSYWTTKKKAYNEVRRMLKEHLNVQRFFSNEEIDNDENGEFGVSVCEIDLDKSWG